MAGSRTEKRGPRRRLTRRIMGILVGLALFQLLAAGVPLVVTSFLNQQQAIQQAQQQAAEKVALSVDAYLRNTTDRLEGFVLDHDVEILLGGYDSPGLPAMLDSLLARSDFLEVWILDTSGHEVFQYSYHRHIDPQDFVSRADSPEYGAALLGRPWYIGPIYVPEDSPLSNLPMCRVAIPMLDPNGKRALLLVELSTLVIQQRISQTPLGEQAYAYIVDQDGILRVHWSDPKIAVEERDISAVPVVQAFLGNHRESSSYQGVNEDIDGLVLGTWAPLDRTRWGVVVEQPVEEAFRGLRRIIIGFIALLLVVSIVTSGGVGALLARGLLRPLGVLQEGAHQLGSGNLAHRIELDTQDEFAVLAGTFNQMAERVQSSHESIEAEVHARTQELSETYEQLRRQSEQQGQLLEMIRSMSVPVIPVLEGVVVMPLVGNIDTERADMVTEALLSGIEEHRAQVVILDITGLPVVDTGVANALLKSMQAAKLLGVWSILVGITPEVAQTVVHLGVDLSQINTRSTLQAGVEYAIRLLRRGSAARV